MSLVYSFNINLCWELNISTKTVFKAVAKIRTIRQAFLQTIFFTPHTFTFSTGSWQNKEHRISAFHRCRTTYGFHRLVCRLRLFKICTLYEMVLLQTSEEVSLPLPFLKMHLQSFWKIVQTKVRGLQVSSLQSLMRKSESKKSLENLYYTKLILH